MLSLKLRRVGKKGQSSFRLVAAEARSKANGASLEILGWINPHTNTFELNNERISHWLKVGAQPTDTARSYIKKSGIEI